jgi:hypothetical protein
LGALKFVLAPKLYSSCLLVRADLAVANSTTPHYLSRTSVNTRGKKKNVTAPIKDDLLFTSDLLLLAMVITSRLPTRSAKADRLDRRAKASAKKVKSPPKHEKNVLLQRLVKHIEEEQL